MFLSIYLKNLRNSEFVQFNQDLLTIISSNNPEELKINEQYTELNQLQETLTSVFKQDQGSSITEEITQIDERRDDAFTGISTLINAYTNHFDDGIKNAAKLLSKSLDSYGPGVIRLNYQAQTSTVADITSKWRTQPELATAVERINLTAWVNHMDAQNSLFNERFLARINETADNPDIKMKEIRDLMIEKYSILLKYISAYATINSNEAYNQVVSRLNTLIEQYNRLLTARKSSTSTAETSVE